MASDLDQQSESIVIQNNTVEDVKKLSELEDGSNFQKNDGSYHNVAAVEDEKAGKQSVFDSPVKEENHESKVTAEEKIHIGQVSAENNSTQFTGSDGISNNNAITKGLNLVSMPELENHEMSMGSKLEKSDQISKTDGSTESNTNKTSYGDSQKSIKAIDNMEEEISGDDSKVCISSEEDSKLIKPSLPRTDVELIASTIGYVDEKQYTESEIRDKTPATDTGDKESTLPEKERNDIMQKSFNEFTPIERGNSFDENDSEVGEVEEENNQLKTEASKISSVLLKPVVDERVEYVNDKKEDENCLEEIQPLTEGETTELLLAEDNGKTKSAEIQVQVEDVPLIEHQEGETPKYLSDGRDSGYEGMSTAEPLIEATKQNVQQIPEEISESRIVNCAEEPELTGEVIEPSPIICQEEYGSKEDIIEQIQPVVEEKATELLSIEDNTKTGTSIAPLIAEDNSSMKTGEIQVQLEDIVQIADQEGESLQDLSDDKESVYEGMATAEPPSKTPRPSAKYISEERSESGVVKSDEPVIVEDDSSMKSAEIQVQVGDLLVLEDQEGESAQQLSDGKESGYEGMSIAEPVMKIEKQNARQISEEISESRILNYAEDEADVTSEAQHSHKEVLEPSLICQEEYDSKEDIIEHIQPLVEETATELPSIEDNTKIGTSIAALIAVDNSSAKTGEIQVQIADQEGESFPDLSDEKESAFEGMATAEPPIETARQSAQNISEEKTESGVVNSVEPVITEDDSSLKSAEIQVQVGNIVSPEDHESELPKHLSGGTNSGYEGMSTAEPVIKTTKQNVQQIPEEISESRILNYAEDEVDVTSEAQHSSQEVLEPSQITCQEAYGSKEDTIEEIQPPVEEKATELPSIEESTKTKTNIAPLITEDNSLTKTREIQVQVEDILQKEDQEGKSVEDFRDEKVSGYEVMVTEEPPFATTRQNAEDKIQPLLGEKDAELPSAEESKDNSSTKTDEIQMKVAEQEGESLEDLIDEKKSGYEGMANAEPPIEIAKQSAQDKIQLLVEEKAAKVPSEVPSAEESTTTGTSSAPLIAEDNSSANTGEIQVQVDDVLKIADDKGESLQEFSDEKESGYEVMATAELPIETAKQSAQDKIQLRLDEKTTELPSAKGSTTTGTSTAPLIAEDNSSVKTGEIQVQVADQEEESLQYVSDEKESRYEGMASAEPPIEIAEHSAQDKIQLLVEEKAAELPSAEEITTPETSIAPLIAEDNSLAETGEIQVQVEDKLQIADQEGESLQDLSDEKEIGYEGMATAEPPIGIAMQSAQDKIQLLVEEKEAELPSVEKSTTTAGDNSSAETGEIQMQVEDILQMADQEGGSLQDLSDEKESGFEGMTSAKLPIETAKQIAQDKSQPHVDKKATELPSAEESTTTGTSTAPLIAEDNSSTKTGEIQVRVADQEGESLQNLSDKKESGYEGVASAEPPIEVAEQSAQDKIQPLVEEKATELPSAEDSTPIGTSIAPITAEDNSSAKMDEIQVQVEDILQITDQEGESVYEGMTSAERSIEITEQGAQDKIQPLVEEKAAELPSAKDSTTAETSIAALIAEDNSSAKMDEMQVQVEDILPKVDQEGESLQGLSDEKESGYEGMATADRPIKTDMQRAPDKIQSLVEEDATELPLAEENIKTGTAIAPLIAEDNNSTKMGEIQVQPKDILQIADQEGESHDLCYEKVSGYEGMATIERPIETATQSAHDKIQPLLEEKATELPSAEESPTTGTSSAPPIAKDNSLTKTGEIQVKVADQEGKSLQDPSDEKESGYEGMSTAEPPIEKANQSAQDEIQPLVEEKAMELPSAEESTTIGTGIAPLIAEDISSASTGEIEVQVEDSLQISDQEGESLQDLSDDKESGYEIMATVEPPIETARQSAQKISEERSESGVVNSVEPVIDEDDSSLKSAETQVQIGNIPVLEDQEGKSAQHSSDGKESGYESMSTTEPVIVIAKQNARQISEDMLETRVINCAEEADLTNEAQQSSQEVLETSHIIQEANSSKEDVGEQTQPLIEAKPTELPTAEKSSETGNSIEQHIIEDSSTMKSKEVQVEVEDMRVLAEQEGVNFTSEAQHSRHEVLEPSDIIYQEAFIVDEIQPLIDEKETKIPSTEESTNTGNSIEPLIAEDNSLMKSAETQAQVENVLQLEDHASESPQELSVVKEPGYEGMSIIAEQLITESKQNAQRTSEETLESRTLNWEEKEAEASSEEHHSSQEGLECLEAYSSKEDIGEQIQPPLEEKPTELPSAEESNKTGNSIEQLIAKDNSSMESRECQVQVEDIPLIAYEDGESPQDFSEGKGSGYEGMTTPELPIETARQSAQKISEERSESGVNWAKEEVHVPSDAQHPSQEVSEPKAYGSKEDVIDSSTEGDNTALMEEKLTDTSSILKECAETMESEVVEHASIEATTESCQVDLSTETVTDVDNDESQSCVAEVGEKEMISEMVEKNESSSKSDLHEENIVQKNAYAGLKEHSDMSDKLHFEESIDTEDTESRPSENALSETASLYIPERITDESCVLPEKKLDSLSLEGIKLADETGLMVDSIQNIPLLQEDHPQKLTEEDENESIRTPVQYIEKVSELNNEEFETNSKPYQPCVKSESDIMKHLEIDETKSDHEEQKHQSSTYRDATEPVAIIEGSTNPPNDNLKVDEKMEATVSQIEKNNLETAERHSIRDVRSAEEDFKNTNAEPSQRRDGTNTNRSNNNEETDPCKELDQYGSNEFQAENPGNQIYEEGTSSNTEGNKKTVVVSSEDESTKICVNNFHAIENDETTDEKHEAQEDRVPDTINDNVLPDQLEELQIDEESKETRRGAHEHECQEVVIDQPISEVERENDIGKYDEMDEENSLKDKEPKGQEFPQDKIISEVQSQITYPATEALGGNIEDAIDDPEQNKSLEILYDKAEASKTAEIGEEHQNDNLTERIHAELADGLQDTTQSVIGNSITLTEAEKYGSADHGQVVENTDEKPAEKFQELATKEVDCVTKAEEYPNKGQNVDQSTEDLEHNYNQSIEEDDDGAQNNVQRVLVGAESEIEEMTDNNMQLSERIGTESVDLEVQNYGKEHQHGECNETTDTEYGRSTEFHSGSGNLDLDNAKESRPYSDIDNPVTSNDEGTRKSGEDVHVIEIQDKLATDYGISPEEVEYQVKSMNVDTDLQQQNERNATHSGDYLNYEGVDESHCGNNEELVSQILEPDVTDDKMPALITSPVIEAVKENIGIATDGPTQNEPSEIENDKAHILEVSKEAGFEAEKHIRINEDTNHENDFSVEENIQAESADKLQYITKSDVSCESSAIIPEVDTYGTADQGQVVDCKDGKPAEKLQEAHSENQDVTIEDVDFVMDAENSLNKTQNIDQVTKDLEHNNNTQSIAEKDGQNGFQQATDADVNQEFQDTCVKSVKLNESSGTESENFEVQKYGREDEKRVCNETDETASVTDTETANRRIKESLYASEKLDQEITTESIPYSDAKNLVTSNEVPEQDEVATDRRHNPEFVTSNEVPEHDYSALRKEVIYANASSSRIRMDTESSEVKHDEQPTIAELMTETTPIESQTSNAFKDPERGIKEESIDGKEVVKQESNKPNADIKNVEMVIKETNLEDVPRQSNDMELLDASSVEESQQKDGKEANPSALEDRDHLAARDYEINTQPTKAQESGDESVTDIRLNQSVQEWEPNDVKQETASNITGSCITSHNVDEINPDAVMQTQGKQALGVENFSSTSFASKGTSTIQDNEELNNEKESDPSSENTTQKPYVSEQTPRELHVHSGFKPCEDLQNETAAEEPVELESKGTNDPLDSEKTESQSSTNSISSEIKSEASPQKKPSKALKVLSQIIHAPDQFHKHARKLLGMKKQSKIPSE